MLTFKITNGKISNENKFTEYLTSLKGIYRLEFKKVQTTRSLNQNNYYWLYLGVIAQETGDDPNSLHEYFKRALLPPKFIKVLGKEIKIPASTTKLSKIEMGEYLERICALTSIPLPELEF